MKSANSSSGEGSSPHREPSGRRDPGANSSAGSCASSSRHSMLLRACRKCALSGRDSDALSTLQLRGTALTADYVPTLYTEPPTVMPALLGPSRTPETVAPQAQGKRARPREEPQAHRLTRTARPPDSENRAGWGVWLHLTPATHHPAPVLTMRTILRRARDTGRGLW